MRQIVFALLATAMMTPGAMAAPSNDVIAPIHQFLDGFNSGDTKSAFAAFARGGISIVDEFPPHLWLGPKALESWAADYDKFALASGITNATVNYGEPIRIEVEGKLAYAIVPTSYRYDKNGQPTAEDGQMIFALRNESGAWKIRSWTWSGDKAHPAK